MSTKIPVTKSIDGDYLLMFDEVDIRKACAIAECHREMIDDCVAEMKAGNNDCATCYINLINDVKAWPTYVKATTQLNGLKA